MCDLVVVSQIPWFLLSEKSLSECGNSDRLVSTVDRQIDKALKGKWHRFNDVFCNPDRTIITYLTMSMLNDQRSSLNFDSTLKHQLVIIWVMVHCCQVQMETQSCGLQCHPKSKIVGHICTLYSKNTKSCLSGFYNFDILHKLSLQPRTSSQKYCLSHRITTVIKVVEFFCLTILALIIKLDLQVPLWHNLWGYRWTIRHVLIGCLPPFISDEANHSFAANKNLEGFLPSNKVRKLCATSAKCSSGNYS